MNSFGILSNGKCPTYFHRNSSSRHPSDRVKIAIRIGPHVSPAVWNQTVIMILIQCNTYIHACYFNMVLLGTWKHCVFYRLHFTEPVLPIFSQDSFWVILQQDLASPPSPPPRSYSVDLSLVLVRSILSRSCKIRFCETQRLNFPGLKVVAVSLSPTRIVTDCNLPAFSLLSMFPSC